MKWKLLRSFDHGWDVIEAERLEYSGGAALFYNDSAMKDLVVAYGTDSWREIRPVVEDPE